MGKARKAGGHFRWRLGVAGLAFALLSPVVLPTLPQGGDNEHTKQLDPGAQPRVLRPTLFEANLGQAAPRYRFLARGAGFDLLFRRRGVDVEPYAAPDAPAPPRLSMGFEGANAASEPAGVGHPTGRVNYLVGNDPSTWVRRAPTFSSIVYEDIYPGIDAVFYEDETGSLEYDFIVRQGNPDVVRLRLSGSPFVNRLGELVMAAGAARAIHRRPYAYQRVHGQPVPVPVRYRILASGEVTFDVGTYQPRMGPLFIDPVLSFSTYLGGTNWEEANDVAVDQAKNAYVAGHTYSSDFPATAGAYGSSLGQLIDGFVTKFSPSGDLVWATYLGGGHNGESWGDDQANAIAVDDSGHVFVGGATSSTDFPTTQNAYDTTGGNLDWDAFVSQLTPDGAGFVYSTYISSSEGASVLGLDIDDQGHAYAAGVTSSPDFPTTANAFQPTYHDWWDAFVTKLSPEGDALEYSTFVGGDEDDRAWSVAVDEAGAAYITGESQSSNFPLTPGHLPAPPPYPAAHAFVTKLAPSGSLLKYSTFLGGERFETGHDIVVDDTGHAYVTGETWSDKFPVKNPVQRYHQVSPDAFVSKLDVSGSGLVYSTFLGGALEDQGMAIDVDQGGRAYVVGTTRSQDFPTKIGLQERNLGGYEAFVAQLSVSGDALGFSTYLGGDRPFNGQIQVDAAYGVAVTGLRRLYVVGLTSATNWPTKNAYQGARSGGGDAFLTKLRPLKDPPHHKVTVTLELHGHVVLEGRVRVPDGLLVCRRQRRVMIRWQPDGPRWWGSGTVITDAKGNYELAFSEDVEGKFWVELGSALIWHNGRYHLCGGDRSPLRSHFH